MGGFLRKERRVAGLASVVAIRAAHRVAEAIAWLSHDVDASALAAYR